MDFSGREESVGKQNLFAHGEMERITRLHAIRSMETDGKRHGFFARVSDADFMMQTVFIEAITSLNDK